MFSHGTICLGFDVLIMLCSRTKGWRKIDRQLASYAQYVQPFQLFIKFQDSLPVTHSSISLPACERQSFRMPSEIRNRLSFFQNLIVQLRMKDNEDVILSSSECNGQRRCFYWQNNSVRHILDCFALFTFWNVCKFSTPSGLTAALVQRNELNSHDN